MIATTNSYHLALVLAEGKHLIESATNLECSRALQYLQLQIKIRSQSIAEALAVDERRTPNEGCDPFLRALNVCQRN
jgi:hypothetical protein